ncbi:MAG: glycosyltransferase involved in cell wall biosynthesis [Gammaproteobacteria bacterium]|jgi:glycosyltransferase involved in cell wall biosynthesis|uniref:glycosyltransferase family 2 protein n=1 Tax=Pseudoalteromonas distincta TaxID=77608 RepID=UPI0039E564B8
MFKRNKAVKPTFNVDLPAVFVDGLVDGQLKGWAQKADTVIISLAGEKLAEVTCQDFRQDLEGVLADPNSSFNYTLTKAEIKKEWRHLTTLVMKAEFIVNGHIDEVAECILSVEQLAEQLNFKIVSTSTQYSFDGLIEGTIVGWCDEADYVDLYIEHEHITSSPCNVERSDLAELIENTKCGFNHVVNGSYIKPHWFLKDNLLLKAVFKQNDNDAVLEQKTISIKSSELLAAVKVIGEFPVTDIAKAIEESHLWDEGYYFGQLDVNEVCHTNRLHDFIIKGVMSGKNPNPHFNTYYYLATNPDVAENGINPFYHYIAIGEKEGRRPVPYFSPKLYLELNPDLEGWDAPLLAHLIMAGLNEGRIYNEYVQPKADQTNADPYQAWRLNNEKDNFLEIQSDLTQFKHQPTISIVVPVYNPEKELLVECIESVRKQSYTNWQLCLADDCSPHEHVREVLEYYQSLDSRISVVFREQNGHISQASNSALEVATGEWVALLDHDDELSQHALYEVVKVLNEKPETLFIYSDEDKINEQGNRCDPHFKSSWNLDLLYSQNYVSHLGVYKTDIISKIGGFRKGYEGSQDYDLLLRYSREIDHKKIVHIPKVLYHWRMVEGSTALGHGEKSYTTEAGIKALEDHFKVLNKAVIVEQGKHANIYKVNWPATDSQGDEPLVSLIIPTYNGYEITKQAIDSILDKTTYQNYEILLVDNNSNDPTALEYFEELDKHEKVTVLRYPYPFNYSAINNFAAKQAKGEVIGLVNNDVEVINPEWLTEMTSHALREDVGCVGAKLYFHNDTIQHAGVIIGIGGVAGHSHKHFKRTDSGYFSRLNIVQNLSAVTAACLLVRKTVFDEVNGLNEEDLTVAFNDVDFCLKVQAVGYRNLWTPYAELYHYESITRGAEDNPVKIARFNKEVEYMTTTWSTDKKIDPCYSKNLTNKNENFSVRL